MHVSSFGALEVNSDPRTWGAIPVRAANGAIQGPLRRDPQMDLGPIDACRLVLLASRILRLTKAQSS